MKKKKILTYVIIFALTLLLFYNFITMHYATDTYNIINRGYKEYAIKYSLNDGRVFMSLISLFADLINLPIEAYIILLTIIALAVSCISVMKIQSFAEKYYKNDKKISKYIILLISYLIIFNFAFLENMQFAECAVMAISILLDIIAAKAIVEKEKNYVIKSCLLMLISVFCYQGTVNWFITITFFFSIIKGENLKDIIKNVLISGIEIIIGIGANLLQVKCTGILLNMTATRMGSINNIPQNITYILNKLMYILTETSGIFPKYLFITFTGALLFISLFLLNNQKKAYGIIGIIFIGIGASLAPHLITLAAFGTARMYYSIGAIIGLVLLYIFINAKDKKIVYNFIVILISIYFVISVYTYASIMYEHKKVNKQDKEEAIAIGKWIEEYENNSGIEVKYIVIVINGKSHIFYDYINNKCALNYRAIYAEWSRIGLLNYYNNRNFEEVVAPHENYKYYFLDKKWDKLDKEQLVFSGPILYLYVY